MEKISSKNKWVFEETPCLVNSPYKEAARSFVEEILRFGRSQFHMTIRCILSISLFNDKVMIEKSKNLKF